MRKSSNDVNNDNLAWISLIKTIYEDIESKFQYRNNSMIIQANEFQLNYLRSVAFQLNNKLNGADKQIQTLQNQIDSISNENDDLSKINAELSRDNIVLTEKNGQLNNEKSDLIDLSNKSAKSAEELEQKITEFTNTCNELENQAAHYKFMHGDFGFGEIQNRCGCG